MTHIEQEKYTELLIISSIFLNPSIMDNFSKIKGDYFSEAIFQNLWKIMEDVHSEKRKITPPAVLNRFSLFFAGDDRERQASQFLSELLPHSLFLTPIDCEYYVDLLLNDFLRRSAIEQAYLFIRQLGTKEDVKTCISNHQNNLINLTANLKIGKNFEDLSEIVDRALIEIEEKYKGESPQGFSTGFDRLDFATGGGFHKGGLTLIGGSTGMGKTAFALSTLYHLGIQGKRCLYFNLEMRSEDLATRLISMHGRVNSLKLKSGTITEEEFGRGLDAGQYLKGLPIQIDSDNNISVEEISLRAIQGYQQRPFDVIFVDYLQILKGKMDRRDRRDQELSDIALQLSNLAKNLNVAVVGLVQLNDDVNKRDNNRPTLSDVRESKSMAHTAESVWLINRSEYYLKDKRPPDTRPQDVELWETLMQEAKGLGEIIIAKNRHGILDQIPVKFEAQYVKYSPLD